MTTTLNTYTPLSSAYSPNSMNIVLFFIRECDVDNCVRYTQSADKTKIFLNKLRSQTRHLKNTVLIVAIFILSPYTYFTVYHSS